jgi:NADH:ubiquinone oxidoreductase subunit
MEGSNAKTGREKKEQARIGRGKGEEERGRCNFGSCKLNSNVGLQELQLQYLVSMQECTRTHPQQYAVFKNFLEHKHQTATPQGWLHLIWPGREASNEGREWKEREQARRGRGKGGRRKGRVQVWILGVKQ